MNKKSKSLPNWKKFELQVASIFELKGFQVETDTNCAGRQTDIFLKSREEFIGNILVECKYHASKKVGVEDVENFLSRVIRLRANGDINVGYLLTNTDFTDRAKGLLDNRPESRYIFLKNIETLTRQLIDFSPYLSREMKKYEASDLLHLYEPLKIKIKNQKQIKEFYKVMQAFIKDKKQSLSILLGDYGVGKTTSCKYLFYETVKQSLDNTVFSRIPLYIPLKEYNYTGSIEALILNFLSTKVGLQKINYLAFEKMNRMGFLILILDGFDEMAKRVTRHIREESFRAIGSLCKGNAKVILSGRPNYFPLENQFSDTIEMMMSNTILNDIKLALGKKNISKKDDIQLSCIAPLNRKQIYSFLEKRTKFYSKSDCQFSAEKIIHKIDNIYNLGDLARRPILLEMIFETIEDIKNEDISNVSDLYHKYTNAWIKIESGKGDFRTLISPDERLLFSLKLAWILFTREENCIHYEDISNIVSDHFDLDELEDLDHFTHDIRTCTFLERDDNGYYSFNHKSFWEFFCAQSLAIYWGYQQGPKVVTEVNEFTLKDIENILPNTFLFLFQMMNVPLNPSFWSNILKTLSLKTYLLNFKNEDEEDSWNNLATILSEGIIYLDELVEILPIIKECYQTLIVFLKNKSIDDNWVKILDILIKKGPIAST